LAARGPSDRRCDPSHPALRKSDAGRRVSCRVTGTLGGEKATVTSTAAKITL